MVVETPEEDPGLTPADAIPLLPLEIAEDPPAEAATTEATLKEATEAPQLTTKAADTEEFLLTVCLTLIRVKEKE